MRPEPGETPLTNNGGQLWVLGLHVNEAELVLDNRSAARTELLGGWIDPRPDPVDCPLVRNVDAELALTHSLSTRAGNVRPYAIDVRQDQMARFREYRWHGGRIIQNRYLSSAPTP
jgi:hypothetical protein